MKNISLATILLIIAFAGTSVPVLAEESAPLYEVEVLVFKNLQKVSDSNEYLVKESGSDTALDIEDAIVIGKTPAENSQLSDAALKMQDSGDYQILSHRQWVQSVDTKTASQPVRINNTGQTFPSLDGTVNFYVSRFLHLDVDLALEDEVSSFLSSDTTIENYRITEARRIKTSDINYFDHPQFGVLILVNAIKTSKR